MTREEARAAIEDWIRIELREYADKQKWDRDDEHHAGIMDDSNFGWWDVFVSQYMNRAHILWGTPGGKQALLKALVTLFEMCVTMYLAENGDIPTAGYPSGEIHE